MTAIAVVSAVAAAVALVLLGVLIVSVQRLRTAVTQTQQSLQELSEQQQPTREEPSTAVVSTTPAVSRSATVDAPPQRRTERSGPSAPSVLNAALGLLVVKVAALSYGLSRALTEESRHEMSRVMTAQLRARRRMRRVEERRARRGDYR